MNSLIELINNDKFQHFVYGLAISGMMAPFGSITMLLVVFLIALIKEYIDSKGFGIKSGTDVVATVSGPVFLIAWYAIIDLLTNMLS
jgi:hypothetical protein